MHITKKLTFTTNFFYLLPKLEIIMKHFIFSKESSAWNRRTGGYTYTFKVGRIIKNKPVFVGQTEANSGAYKGDVSHVMNFLANVGAIPAKFKDGYYRTENNTNFRIHTI